MDLNKIKIGHSPGPIGEYMKYEEWIESNEYKNMFCIAGDMQKFKGTDKALNYIIKTAYNAGKRPNQVNRPDACTCELRSACGHLLNNNVCALRQT